MDFAPATLTCAALELGAGPPRCAPAGGGFCLRSAYFFATRAAISLLSLVLLTSATARERQRSIAGAAGELDARA